MLALDCSFTSSHSLEKLKYYKEDVSKNCWVGQNMSKKYQSKLAICTRNQLCYHWLTKCPDYKVIIKLNSKHQKLINHNLRFRQSPLHVFKAKRLNVNIRVRRLGYTSFIDSHNGYKSSRQDFFCFLKTTANLNKKVSTVKFLVKYFE